MRPKLANVDSREMSQDVAEQDSWKVAFPTVLFIVTLALLLAHRVSANHVDPDLWHEMALAREIAQLGYIPWEDSFAYTERVYPVVHHEWGAGVIAYGLTRVAGAPAIIALKGTLVAMIAVFSWLAARRNGAGLVTFGMLSIVAIFLADEGFSTVRAQMYSFAFACVMMWFFSLDRAGIRWWLPVWLVLHVLWLNIHAGFLFGCVLYFLNWVETLLARRPHRHLLIGGIVLGALIMVNPYGWHYYNYLARASMMPRPHISEWYSMLVTGRPHQWAALILACGTAIAIALQRKRQGESFVSWLLLIVSALYAFKHARMLPFFGFIWLIHMSAYVRATRFGQTLETTFRDRSLHWSVIWGCASVAALIAVGQSKPWALVVPGSEDKTRPVVVFPVGPVEYLESQQLEGNILLPFDQGAYISWKRWPHNLVSIDSRYEVAYPKGALEANYRLFVLGSASELDEQAIHADFVLCPSWSPLNQVLQARDLWRRVYRDDTFSMYSRDPELPEVDRRGEEIFGVFP